MTPLRAVTLDVGGTLIEPWPSVGHVYADVALEEGVGRFDPDELNRKFAQSWAAKKGFGHSQADWERLVQATFASACHPPPGREFFLKLYARFVDPSVWRIFPDVQPALEKLERRGLALALVSNWDERLRPLLAALGLSSRFPVQVISCDVGACKPSPAIFQEAAARLQVAPGEILHVGDSRREDLEGALAAGFRAVLIDRQATTDAPAVIRSLEQIPLD